MLKGDNMFLNITKTMKDDGSVLYIIHDMGDITKPHLVLEEPDFITFKDTVNLMTTDPSMKSVGVESRVLDIWKKNKNLIQCIKEYRALTNCGLAEAKMAVEKLIAPYR